MSFPKKLLRVLLGFGLVIFGISSVLAGDPPPSINPIELTASAGLTANLVSGSYYTNDSTPTISATFTAGSAAINETSAVLRVNGVPNPSVTSRDSTHIEYTPSSALTNRTYSTSVDVKDVDGIPANRVSRTVIVDTTAPATPSITSPSDGTISTNDTPTVSGTAEAASAVDVLAGGSLVGTTTTDSLGNWSLQTSDLGTTGNYSLTARASDRAGNTSADSLAVSYNVDQTAPNVPTLTDQTNTNNNQPTLAWSDESASGATSYRLQIDNDSDFSSPLIDDPTISQTSAALSSALTDASYFWRVSSTDVLGNTSSFSDSDSFNVDTIAPTVSSLTLSDPSPSAAGTLTFTFEFSESLNQTNQPEISFGPSSPFSQNALTGDFLDSDTWQGTTVITVSTGDGTNTVSVSGFEDLVGNQGSTDTTNSFVIDTTLPSVTLISPNGGEILGGPSNTSQTIEWTATDSHFDSTPIMLEYSQNGGTSYTTITNATENDGFFDWALPEIDSSDVLVRLTATDQAGNSNSDLSNAVFRVDKIGPSAPSSTGIIPSSPTNNSIPSVTGSVATDVTTVRVAFNSTTKTVSPSAGSFSASPDNSLADGSYIVSATAFDDLGNPSSPESVASDYLVDTTAPVIQLETRTPAPNLTVSDNTPTVSVSYTEDGSLALAAGISLTINGVAVPTNQITVTSGGSFMVSHNPTSPFDDGELTLEISATDQAGNSSTSSSWSFSISTGPSLTSVLATGGTQVADFVNSTNTGLTVSGTKIADSEGTSNVELLLNGNSFTTPASVDLATNETNWSITLSSAQFSQLTSSQGVKNLSAKATSFSGAQSLEGNSQSLTVDTEVPSTPELTNLSLTQNPPGSSDTVAGLAGAVEASASVKIYSDGSLMNQIAGASASSNGSFGSIDIGDNLYQSIYLTASDQAGNQSSPSSLTNDISAPSAPTISSPVDGSITNNATLTVLGSAEASSTVQILDGLSLIGTGLADGSGNFSITTNSLSDGSHSLTARASDQAGNQSSSSSTVSVTLDTVAPTVINTTPTDGSYSADSTPTITITWTDGSGVGLDCSSRNLSLNEADVTADSNCDAATGVVSYTPAFDLDDGQYTASSAINDLAGSIGANSYSFFIDTQAPSGTVSIVSGATHTTTTSVNLTLEASDPAASLDGTAGSGTTTMTIGFMADLSDGTEESFAASKAISLPNGDGVKTVYAQFKDSVGNQSSIVSDTIVLDSLGPTFSSIMATSNNVKSASLAKSGDTVTVSFTSSETLSGDPTVTLGGALMTKSSQTGNDYSYTRTLNKTETEGQATIALSGTDLAGNIATDSSTAFSLDFTPPSASLSLKSPQGYTANNMPDVDIFWSDSGTGLDGPTATMTIDDISVAVSFDSASGRVRHTPAASFDDGEYTVSGTIEDSAGSIGIDPFSFNVDTQTPSGGLLVNNDAALTNTTAVSLSLTRSDPAAPDATAGSGVTQVRVSEDPTFTDVNYQNYPSDDLLAFNLSSGDGTKTVYAQFKDSVGNQSSIVSDTIVLDSLGPTFSSIMATSNNVKSASLAKSGDTVTVSFTSSETLSGDPTVTLGGALMTKSSQTGNDYSYTRTLNKTETEGQATIALSGTDLAGNIATDSSTAFSLDFTPPSQLPLSSVIEDMDGDNIDDDITANQQLLIKWPASSDAGSGVDHYLLTIKRTSTSGTTIINTFNVGNVTSYTLTSQQAALITPDATYFAGVKATDAAGNTANNRFSDGITLDTTAPTGTLTINAGAARTGSTTVSLNFTSSGASQVRVSQDSSFGAGSDPFVSLTDPIEFTLSSGDGTKTVYAQFKDSVGNQSSTVSDTIELDQTAPAAPTLNSLTSPSANSTPSLTGTAEPGSTVTVLDSSLAVGTGTADPSIGTFSITTSVLTDGSHSLSATASDDVGNTSTNSNTVSYEVDTSGPVFSSISAVSNNAAPTLAKVSNTVTLTFTSSETLSGDPTVTLGGALMTKSGQTGNDYSYTRTLNGTESQNSASFVITGTDSLGNTATDSSTTFIIDFTAPTISNGAPTGTISSTSPTIQATIADTGGSEVLANSVALRLNGVKVTAAFDSSTGLVSFTPISPLATGVTYRVTVDARDTSGNIANRATFTFTITP